MKHVTVLLNEAVSHLSVTRDATIVDATLGAGGHAREILKLLGPKGTYIGIDADLSALHALEKHMPETNATVHLVNDNFRNISDILSRLAIEEIDGILADLGWHLDQFTEGKRGFSFTKDAPLLMTYGDPAAYIFTARDIVNEWDEIHIADVLYGYGGERYSRRIARKIVEVREKTPIETARELAEIIVAAYPKGRGRRKIHPATKTFQALRIAVNDELGALHALITNGFMHVRPGGRIAIITFHSLEDKIVKQLFLEYVQRGEGILLSKKPFVPTLEELKENPRARSAKLRIIEKQ